MFFRGQLGQAHADIRRQTQFPFVDVAAAADCTDSLRQVVRRVRKGKAP